MKLYEAIAKCHADSVVTVVINGNAQVLLGKSRHSDDRKGKWCFPGGHIEPKESIESAACREVKEESGLDTRYYSIIQYGSACKVSPKIVFVLCLADANGDIQPSNEFSELKWFRPSEALNSESLYDLNRDVLTRLIDFNLTEEALNEFFHFPTRILKRVNMDSAYSNSSCRYSEVNSIDPKRYFLDENVVDFSDAIKMVAPKIVTKIRSALPAEEKAEIEFDQAEQKAEQTEQRVQQDTEEPI